MLYYSEIKHLQKLHLISFNVPWPADYGGAIDVYYKLKALHALGVEVILHCFFHDRPNAPELEALCEAVHYYPRRSNLASFSWRYPMMMNTRKSSLLLKRLLEDDYPILFEGMHTCSYLPHPALRGRQKLVRMHNLEWDYYYALSRTAPWPKSVRLRWEAAGLKAFEGQLNHADALLAISKQDAAYLKSHFPKVVTIPPFHGHDAVISPTGMGEGILYHANLSVAENEEAVKWILGLGLSYPLTIAGKAPTARIRRWCSGGANVILIADPDSEAMQRLVAGAHIHLMPTFQATGAKLKLLSALFTGRHVAATPDMVAGTGLRSLCAVAESEGEMKAEIERMMKEPFTETQRAERQQVLTENFSDRKNLEAILSLLRH